MFPNVVEDPSLRDKTFVFKDRLLGAKLLAQKLSAYAHDTDSITLAIPAGGIPVGYVMSTTLAIALDLIVVRKVQVPWDPEVGFGAVAWKGEMILDRHMIAQLGLSETEVDKAVSKASANVRERVEKFRKDRPLPDLRGKKVLIVDDGLATGFTMLAAVRTVKKEKPDETIVAVPTASMSAIELLAKEADLLVALNIRTEPFFAVADAYKNWSDVSEAEAVKFLERAWHS